MQIFFFRLSSLRIDIFGIHSDSFLRNSSTQLWHIFSHAIGRGFIGERGSGKSSPTRIRGSRTKVHPAVGFRPRATKLPGQRKSSKKRFSQPAGIDSGSRQTLNLERPLISRIIFLWKDFAVRFLCKNQKKKTNKTKTRKKKEEKKWKKRIFFFQESEPGSLRRFPRRKNWREFSAIVGFSQNVFSFFFFLKQIAFA